MKILVFDKFLGFNVGGAQRSLHLLLQSLNSPDLTYLGCNVAKSFGSNRSKIDDMPVERFSILELPRWPYLEYLVNRLRLKKIFSKKSESILITQGLWGAAAVSFFSGKSIYFIRDEYQLNRIPLYQGGIKKFFKLLYLFLQLPGILMLWSDNRKAVKKASVVVANSQYIKSEISKKFNRDSEIIYPAIEINKYVHAKIDRAKQKYITCIGSEYMKGRTIVEAIAQKMPEQEFMIVGREFKVEKKQKNILYVPWADDPLKIYSLTKVLIIPSICAEAFGRVGIESRLLGIPVVASNRGGLREAVEPESLISNIWDIKQWCEKIMYFILSDDRKKFLTKEDMEKYSKKTQVQKFFDILRHI